MVLQPTEPVDPKTVIRRRAVSGLAAAICIERHPLLLSREGRRAYALPSAIPAGNG
jgi:hypothetical protein